MPHQLWETKEWQSASDEEVIAALFDCPAHLDPFDVAAIKRHKPHCVRQYHHLYYGGEIPNFVRRVHKSIY